MVLSPQDLIFKSLETGGSVEHLEKLLEMQFRWEEEEARKNYYKAMAAFKAACPPVLIKDRTVAYQQVRYNHTSLGAAVVAVTPYLSAEGLSATWAAAQPGNGTVEITCIIAHKDGHRERTTLVGPLDKSGSKNAIQQLGSSTSYLQRYTLLAALGIATADQDDDAVAMNQHYTPANVPTESEPVEALPTDPDDDPSLDEVVADGMWARAYELARTLDEVQGIGRAIAGQVEKGPERDELVRAHYEAIKRCTESTGEKK